MTIGVAVRADGAPVPKPARRRSREARLRAEFAALYSGVRVGEWMSAATLADRVLATRLLRGSATALRGRLLLDAHFEFRGGEAGPGLREGVRSGAGP
jgi:hypothetical protein